MKKQATKRIDPKVLDPSQRSKIFHLVAAGYPISKVAADYKVKYASVRHIVFGQWAKLYPDHFAKHGTPLSLDKLRSYPLTNEKN